MHNFRICTISSPVPIIIHNTVQVPCRILTCEANEGSEELSSPAQTAPHSGLCLMI